MHYDSIQSMEPSGGNRWVVVVRVVVDRIRLSGEVDMYNLAYIGKFDYHKPGLAADLLMFIRDREGKVFFVGIERKFPPGEGRPATLGGFLNIDDYYLDAPAYALLHEGREEAGMRIEPQEHDKDRLKHDIFADNLAIAVTLNGQTFCATMRLIGTYPTSKEEKIATLMKKRVYWTTGYSIVVDIDRALNKNILKTWFKAGDDVLKMLIYEITAGEVPEFFIEHQGIVYDEALIKHQFIK